MSGIVKPWLIESTLDFVQSDDYYPHFADKVSYLMYSIAMNHYFADGNKRTALVAAMQFILLNTNDSDLASRFMREFENIVVWVADGSLSKQSLTEYVDGFLWVGPAESTLLKIYQELHQHNLV
jgi:death on curing protein